MSIFPQAPAPPTTTEPLPPVTTPATTTPEPHPSTTGAPLPPVIAPEPHPHATHPPATPPPGTSVPHPTPRKRKEYDPYVTNSDAVRAESPNVKRWADRVDRRLWVYDGSVDDFLRDYVPSSATVADYALPSGDMEFSKVPVDGPELDMFGPLEKSLNKLVADIEQPRRLTFVDTHLESFPTPHETIHEQPDIIYLHPTLSVHEGLHYAHCAGVIEVKPRTSQDPIKDGKLHQTIDARKTIVQIAKNARSLLMDNMSCFVFVIGIYGHTARIYRFDRAGVIVSPSFDYKISPAILGRFFYQLVHPAAPATSGIVGADHTITPTGSDKKVVLLLTLMNVHKYTFEQAAAALNPSYRFDVKFGDDDDNRWTHCFSIGEPLSSASGLFGRATVVWAVLIQGQGNGNLYALKDSWRECHRRSDHAHYEVLRKHRELNCPLADCAGSVDLRVELVEGGYQTSSMTKLFGQKYNRTRSRLLLYPIGFHLTSFSSTRFLVEGIRDAVKGYWLAWKSKILHRDISIGNILLIDRHPFKGFLHDFDYSVYLGNYESEIDVDKSLKDMTGTFQFMAVEILDNVKHKHAVHHDLESFYWILTWIALNHLNHNHPNGRLAHTKLFDVDDTREAAKRKREWLEATPLTIEGNPPLSLLLSDMTNLCKTWVPEIRVEREPKDHYSEFLNVMDKALAMDGWPEADRAHNFPLPSVQLAGKISQGQKALMTRKRRNDSQIESMAKRSCPSLQSLPVTREESRPISGGH